MTLVDVHAVHHGLPVLVPFGTLALEAALQVYTLRVALARVPNTFVVVYALMRLGVVDVTSVAVTLEAARRVDALPVLAHRRHHFALVYLLRFVRYGVDDLSGSGAA